MFFLLDYKPLWGEERALFIVEFPSKPGLYCTHKRLLHITLMRVNIKVL